MFKKFIKSKLFFISIYLLFMPCVYAMEVAITVDDLPYNDKLPPNTTSVDVANQMIHVFKKHHIKGVYGFINANKIEKEKTNNEVLINWVRSGNYLGNHTFSHSDLAKVSIDFYITDIEKNELYLKQAMGDENYKYFRYPYLAEGNTLEKRDAIRKYLFKHQYKIAEVTTDFFDYEWNPAYIRCLKKNDNNAINWLKKSYIEQALNALTISHELSKMMFHRDIKNILLIHLNAFDAEMLDKLLTEYERRGVRFISLNNALQDDVYQINPNVVSNRTYTFLNQIRLSRKLKNPLIVQQLYDMLPEEKLNRICPL